MARPPSIGKLSQYLGMVSCSKRRGKNSPLDCTETRTARNAPQPLESYLTYRELVYYFIGGGGGGGGRGRGRVTARR